MNDVTTRLTHPSGGRWWLLLALLFGIAASWVDLHQSEVQPAVACLLVGGLLLGLARPHGALLRAAIIGLAIPIAHLLARWRGWSVAYPTDATTPWFALLALIPASIGALIGAAIRRAVTPRAPERIA